MKSEQTDIQQLFELVAPERAGEIADLLTRSGITYERVHDQPGFYFRTLDRVVLYNDRALRLIYLISALAWKALVEQSGAIIVFMRRGQPYDYEALLRDSRYVGLERTVDALAQAISESRGAEALDQVAWPKDIPMPDPRTGAQDFARGEDRAAYQTAVLALSWILLHETQHALYAVAGNGPGGLPEEHACDDYASRFIIERTSAAAIILGQPEWRIRSQRGIGILLAQAIIVEMTPESRWNMVGEHPRVRERLEASIECLALPPEDDAWVFAGAVLLAQLRRAGRHLGAIPFSTPLDLYRALLTRL